MVTSPPTHGGIVSRLGHSRGAGAGPWSLENRSIQRACGRRAPGWSECAARHCALFLCAVRPDRRNDVQGNGARRRSVAYVSSYWGLPDGGEANAGSTPRCAAAMIRWRSADWPEISGPDAVTTKNFDAANPVGARKLARGVAAAPVGVSPLTGTNGCSMGWCIGRVHVETNLGPHGRARP